MGACHTTPNFTVSAPSSATIATNYEVRHTAVSPGQIVGQPISAYFDVIAMPAVASLTVSPTSVIGGVTNATGTVTLGSAAPTGGASVSLSSNNTGAASVPGSVTVSAGSTTANFTVTTHTLSSAVNVTLTASYSGSSQQATLRVVPQPSVSSVTLLPVGVTGGSNSTGTVTLSSEAPSGGISVGLSSNQQAASMPSNVTVAAGATSANFNVTTTAVANAVSATITASYNSTNKTATLNIYPPQLEFFTISPGSVNGGQDVTATFTLDGPAPTGGAGVVLTCSNTNAATIPGATPPVFPYTVTVPAGQTSTTQDIHTSTVNYPTTLTFTANYNAQIQANLTLNQANLWLVSLYPSTINLAWNVSAQNQFQLTRSVPDGNGGWTQQMSVTLDKSSTSYADLFAFSSGQSYLYQLYDYNSGTGVKTLLAQEQVVPYQSNTTEDQTVDSRIDPRYSTTHYLDFQFGSGIYRGGLYAGFMSVPQGQNTPPDSSRIGRSFAKFPLTAYPTSGTFRTGGIAAYLTGCNTDQGDVNGLQIGCQPLSTNSWVGSTLTWESAPTVTPSNAQSVVTINYSASNPTPGWYYWPMGSTILSTLPPTGSQLLSVAWASINEASNGWAYFAKQEYDSTLAPCAVYGFDLPIPLSISVSPSSVPSPGTATVSILVNGLGPNDTATVSLTTFPSSLPSGWVPSSVTVTGLTNPYTFTFSVPQGFGGGSYQFSASCNNVGVLSPWITIQ